MAPIDAIVCFQSRCIVYPPLFGYLPASTLPPYRSVSNIRYASKSF